MEQLFLIVALCFLSGCSTLNVMDDSKFDDMIPASSPIVPVLDGKPMTVAVYKFSDLTGQRKPGEKFANISTAVTQGGLDLLIMSLSEIGDGKWFNVLERTSLDSLIKERQLIRNGRESVSGNASQKLPTLVFAGVMINGGIIGYDSNIATGGDGARFLGIGITTQFREDVVTVSLRLTSIATGEILVSATSSNTIYSTSIDGSIFRFVDLGTELVELETGSTKNEPVTFAVKRAIDKAVVNLIFKGYKKDLWEFKLD